MGIFDLFKKKAPAPAAPVKPRLKSIRINVAGTSYKQAEIKSIGEHNDDFDLTKRELREDFEGEKVYALDFDPIVELVPDPENPHDKNAIKVVADGVHVGYIPKKETGRVREILSSGDLRKIRADVTGGKYKKVTSDNELVRGEDSFRVELQLSVEDREDR